MNDPCDTQDKLDKCTAAMTNIMIDCALQADFSESVKRPSGPKSKGKQKKRSHPKWHDLSCAEAHRKVVLTNKMLKN
jgi:hypothetical protein